eukprot:symbB.v1.2.027756.t1/scaffold2735.1/size73862/4
MHHMQSALISYNFSPRRNSGCGPISDAGGQKKKKRNAMKGPRLNSPGLQLRDSDRQATQMAAFLATEAARQAHTERSRAS